jgi:hypothetical protein
MIDDDDETKRRKKREQRFIALLGRLGSDHEAERISALQKVTKAELEPFGLTSWTDVGVALVQRFKLFEAAEALAQERNALQGEVERLRRNANANGGSLAQALWQDTSLPRSIESKHAEWVQGLGIYLTPKEHDFLNSCARWRGPLRPAQRDWLQDILRNAVARTGQAPPP